MCTKNMSSMSYINIVNDLYVSLYNQTNKIQKLNSTTILLILIINTMNSHLNKNFYLNNIKNIKTVLDLMYAFFFLSNNLYNFLQYAGSDGRFKFSWKS